jgi:hypothetical protein
MTEFTGFNKIPRLNRDMVITEKIDGTNAQIWIVDLATSQIMIDVEEAVYVAGLPEGLAVFAGSRSRWLQPGKNTDNHGFAAWVSDNIEELLKLGVGRHFGEWWGQGINRGYGLDHRRFSLFNVKRWTGNPDLPPCCEVVPVLYEGPFTTLAAVTALESLRQQGSHVAPGFMRPEGIVVHHVAAGVNFKVTFDNDEKPKGQVLAS